MRDRGSPGHARCGTRVDHVKVRPLCHSDSRQYSHANPGLRFAFPFRIGLIPDHDDDVMDEQK